MELRHLRYFVAVARTRNFTRAAEALGIHQPPLSRQIADLERELGFRLFERHAKGVELTAGGRVFRERAEAILASVDDAAKGARHAAEGTSGSLALGFTSSTMTHAFTPELIRRYRDAHPEVELAIHEGNAAQMSERVAAGRVDAALIRLPVLELARLAYRKVLDEPLLVALPAAHRLAAKARSHHPPAIALRELAAEAFILVRRPGAQGMYGDLIAACHKLGFAPNVVAEVGHMLTNITLVAAGYGVSVVPASMAEIHMESVLYCVPRDAPQLKAPLQLVTRLGNGNPAVERFVEFTVALAAQLAAPGRPRASRSRPASGARPAGGARPASPRSRARARKP
jgi:DNA-binding transcriptional LysR family regulator